MGCENIATNVQNILQNFRSGTKKYMHLAPELCKTYEHKLKQRVEDLMRSRGLDTFIKITNHTTTIPENAQLDEDILHQVLEERVFIQTEEMVENDGISDNCKFNNYQEDTYQDIVQDTYQDRGNQGFWYAAGSW